MRRLHKALVLMLAGTLAVFATSAVALDPEELEREAAADEAAAAALDPAVGDDPARPHGPTVYERVAGVDGLYAALGERAGIERFIDRTVEASLVDPRIASFFTNADVPLLKERLTDQVCQLAGGPCVYDGADMASAHTGQGIRSAHFNALVENLQAAMEAERVPFAAQNRVLALLAPMRPHIVGR
jgi:hemoglobin